MIRHTPRGSDLIQLLVPSMERMVGTRRGFIHFLRLAMVWLASATIGMISARSTSACGLP
jgi:hypothetical protein